MGLKYFSTFPVIWLLASEGRRILKKNTFPIKGQDNFFLLDIYEQMPQAWVWAIELKEANIYLLL